MDSLTGDGRLIRAWTMETRKTPKTLKLNNKPVSYRSYIALRVFDCRSRRSAIIQGTFYDRPQGEGDVLHSFSIPLSKELFSVVSPSSMGEALLEAACEQPPQRKIQV